MRASSMSFALVTLVLALLSASAASSDVRPLPNSWIRGIDYFALKADQFNGTKAHDLIDENLRGLDHGATHVALQWMWKVENATASTVFSSPSTTPPIAHVEGMVRHCNARGLRVILKICVVSNDGTEMMDLQPANLTEFFASYGALFAEVMNVAYRHNVDTVAVGMELLRLVANPDAEPLWRQLIRRSRAQCPSCRFTYGSNPMFAEHALVRFWDELDFIGTDVYIPFIISRDPAALKGPLPNLTAMQETYSLILEAKLLAWYRNYSAARLANGTNPLKILILESGYPSSNYGTQNPWLPPPNCTMSSDPDSTDIQSNFTAQAAGFEATFAVLTAPDVAPSFEGFVQFWIGAPESKDYYPTRNASNSLWACDWSVMHKPAQAVLAAAFRRSV